jgi:hypothetical protein
MESSRSNNNNGKTDIVNLVRIGFKDARAMGWAL